MHGGFFVLFGQSALLSGLLLLLITIDIGDNNLYNNDEWDGKEHPGRTEQFAAKDDAEDDGDGMEVE